MAYGCLESTTTRSEPTEGYAMAEKKSEGRGIRLQEIFNQDRDGLKELLREALHEVLGAEIREAPGAGKYRPQR